MKIHLRVHRQGSKHAMACGMCIHESEPGHVSIFDIEQVTCKRCLRNRQKYLFFRAMSARRSSNPGGPRC